MPFGGGESLCPGRHFAKNEIAQFVAGVLLEFDLALDPVCAGAMTGASRPLLVPYHALCAFAKA